MKKIVDPNRPPPTDFVHQQLDRVEFLVRMLGCPVYVSAIDSQDRVYLDTRNRFGWKST